MGFDYVYFEKIVQVVQMFTKGCELLASMPAVSWELSQALFHYPLPVLIKLS